MIKRGPEIVLTSYKGDKSSWRAGAYQEMRLRIFLLAGCFKSRAENFLV